MAYIYPSFDNGANHEFELKWSLDLFLFIFLALDWSDLVLDVNVGWRPLFHHHEKLLITYFCYLIRLGWLSHNVNNILGVRGNSDSILEHSAVLLESCLIDTVLGLYHHAIQFLFQENVLQLNSTCNIHIIIAEIAMLTLRVISIHSYSLACTPSQKPWPAWFLISFMISLLIAILTKNFLFTLIFVFDWNLCEFRLSVLSCVNTKHLVDDIRCINISIFPVLGFFDINYWRQIFFRFFIIICPYNQWVN